MENQFVTYEIAKQLKELGFDQPCFGKYMIKYGDDRKFDKPKLLPMYQNPVLRPIQFAEQYNKYEKNSEQQLCLAPLWQQVIDWLIKEYNLFICIEDHIFVDVINDGSGYKYYIDIYGATEVGRSGFIDTYQQAREQAILKAIELIKNNNENL